LVGTSNMVDSRVVCTLSTGRNVEDLFAGETHQSTVLDWGRGTGRAWVDFDGDGKADFCRLTGTENRKNAFAVCTLSTGKGFGISVESAPLDWGDDHARAWVDFNGDGKADYCRLIGRDADQRVSCTLSEGSQFGKTIVSDKIGWGEEGTRLWGDVNGDGKADFCRVIGKAEKALIACTLSNGDAFGKTIFDVPN